MKTTDTELTEEQVREGQRKVLERRAEAAARVKAIDAALLTAVGRAILEERSVDNPYMTNGLHEEPATRGHRYTSATISLVSRYGALAFIRRREAHHEEAGARFKALYEALYGMGGSAIDPRREPVDQSLVAHDSGMAARLDGSHQLRQAMLGLDVDLKASKARFDRLVALLVLEEEAGCHAAMLPSGRRNDRQVRAAVSQALADLDALAVLWGYMTRKAA